MIIKTKNAEFDSKSIFTPIDVFIRRAEINQFINKTVYVGDTWAGLLHNIEYGNRLRLKSVDTEPRKVVPFMATNNTEWHFCLPASAVNVIKQKKKYRPFKSASEFERTLKIDQLDTVVMRDKVHKNYIQIARYLGFVNTAEGLLQAIIIGCDKFGPESLFKGYEWQDLYNEYSRASDTWHPFGIEVKNE